MLFVVKIKALVCLPVFAKINTKFRRKQCRDLTQILHIYERTEVFFVVICQFLKIFVRLNLKWSVFFLYKNDVWFVGATQLAESVTGKDTGGLMRLLLGEKLS